MDTEWAKRLASSDRSWVPPTRFLLGGLQSGEAFTKVLPRVLLVLVAVATPGVLLGWLGGWYLIYREYERWGLVLAFVAHLFLLFVLYVLLRIVYLRATHLRTLPCDDYSALRAIAIGLRLAGEVLLVVTLGFLGYSVLQPSPAQWFQTFGLGQYSGTLGAVSKLALGGLGAGSSVVGFVLFFAFYAKASAIDANLAIEYNTSCVQAEAVKRQRASARGSELPPATWSTLYS